MKERLQKVLAGAGCGSRREIEQWIRAGKITVNGQVAELGLKISHTDIVKVNGQLIKLKDPETTQHRVIAYHKPVGEVSTRSDPEGRQTIFKNLPKIKNSRWVSVGRLDINTSGLMILTTDGQLANALMHPSSELEREYAIRILGEVSPATLSKLKQGVMLEDGIARLHDLHVVGGEGANKWYQAIVKEGRNRLVRRLWESQGLTVSRLIRVRYGPISLESRLRAGHWEDLTEKQVSLLKQSVGLSDSPSPRPKAEESQKTAGKRTATKTVKTGSKKSTTRKTGARKTGARKIEERPQDSGRQARKKPAHTKKP